MQDAKDDLRATSDALEADATLLASLEARKQDLDPADPQVVELSRQVEDLVSRMGGKATAERELSEEIQEG